MSVGNIGRINRDGKYVCPYHRPFRRRGIGNVDTVVCFIGAIARLQHVARVTMGYTQVAVGQVTDIGRTVEITNMWARGSHDIGSFLGGSTAVVIGGYAQVGARGDKYLGDVVHQ